MRYEFEDVVVDTDAQEMHRAGSPVHVEPQVFDVLAVLLAHRDRVVPKTELLDTVWESRFVSESALSSRIRDARKAIGDDGRTQRLIKTSHGRGFRFVGDVVERGAHRSDGAESEASAPAPTPPRRSNLPRRRGPLVGRADELDGIARRLTGGSLVTVVGPGGAGKTTLAAEAGRRALDGRPVWFCELAGVRAGRVAGAVLGAIEGGAGGHDVTAAQIVDRLGPDASVLILDNCEHVVDDVATLVDDVLDLADAVAVLATSREPLDIRGETVIRIDGLATDGPEPAAVALLAACAESADHALDLVAEEPTLRQIAARLEGLPLAIELAAPRLASLTPAELLAALDDQLSVLRSQRRHDARQSAMDRTIGWSFDLLGDDERTVLVELGIFAGAFTVDAAEAVLGRPDGAAVVHRLVEQSMVVHLRTTTGSRFRLLEPIRQFVDRQLDIEGRVRLAGAHAEYFARRVGALATDLDTAAEAEAAEHLGHEWSDVARALAWARDQHRRDLAVEPLLQLGTHILWRLRTEAFGWLAAAEDRFGPLGPAAETLLGLAAWSRNDFDEAEERTARAEVAAGSTIATAVSRFNLALARDDLDDARRQSERIHELAAGQDGRWQLLASCYGLVGAVMAEPDGPLTEAMAAEVRDAVATTDWPSGRAMAHGALVVQAMTLGDAEAMTHHRAEVERACAAGGAPWFTYLSRALSLPPADDGVPMAQLETAVASLRSALAADDQVQLPAILRTVVVGLSGIGRHDEVARLSGLVPQLRGVGRGGQFSPGYDGAVDAARQALGDAAHDRLAEEGLRLRPAEALARAEGAVAEASSAS